MKNEEDTKDTIDQKCKQRTSEREKTRTRDMQGKWRLSKASMRWTLDIREKQSRKTMHSII